MNNLRAIRLSDLKIQASFLLKNLRNKPDSTSESVKRFLQIPSFSLKSEEWLIENSGFVKLKHAYAVIAHENGFHSWIDLKETVIKNDCLYNPSCVGIVYAWFKNYSDAEEYFKKNGGYLLTFWRDYVVCGNEYITCIGLNQYEEQWQAIGYNWVHPKDNKAFQYLQKMAKTNYQSRQ
ncbi:hypothetical protein JKA74_07315 [Marivirga sp. S37H4]|uniref:Uncharacterized protein n=1 Tax=Marivirga aurantiaca TaxID=2802615 RepID=A0A934WXV8_9BACT|nr:hypothetical protein [Marivirga aurantiaca]MBK6264840.1 hypothetical protein [Marivirga aurantiaca]